MVKIEKKLQLLYLESSRWIGVKEVGGDNKGQLVEMFQKAVDGKAHGEAWCLSFIKFNLNWVDKVCREVFDDEFGSKLFQTEHVMTMWHKSPKELRRTEPKTGYIAVWRHKGTTNGHAGIVSTVLPSARRFNCIEGNTGPGAGVVREGDGVYERSRSMDGAGSMELLGFLVPWAT